MQQRARYNAVVIGAGRIGSEFDSPKSSMVLTHAHALSKHRSIELVGFYDSEKKASAAAARKWKARAIPDYGAMRNLRPDIISICTPDVSHFSVLKQVLHVRPKLVICEKPFSSNPARSNAIISLYRKKKIPILVNYTLLFDPFVQKLRKDILNGTFGKILAASSIYSNGVLHNGPHIVSLATYLFGRVNSFRVLFSRPDRLHDRGVGCFMDFERCEQFYMIIGDARKFSNYEFDIVFEKKRIRIFQNGLAWSSQEVRQDSTFKGYRVLGPSSTKKTSYGKAMSEMVQNAVMHLEKKKPLRCDSNDALTVENICHELYKQSVK